jgi:hypothetical protein
MLLKYLFASAARCTSTPEPFLKVIFNKNCILRHFSNLFASAARRTSTPETFLQVIFDKKKKEVF